MDMFTKWWSASPPPPPPPPSMSEVQPENMIPGTEYYIETLTDYLPAPRPDGPDGPDGPDEPDESYVSGVMKCIGTFMNLRIYEGKNAPFFVILECYLEPKLI